MRFKALLLLIVLSNNCVAMQANEVMHTLSWHHRVLIIFTPTADDAQFKTQDAMLLSQQAGLEERDIVTIKVVDAGAVLINDKQHPATVSSFRERYNIKSNEFRVVLVGKDGSVKLEQSEPVTTKALFKLIDAMPMRQYEMLQHDD